MPTQCTEARRVVKRVEGRVVVANFDGGELTSDAGALLLGRTDETLGLLTRLAGCFQDARDPQRVEHAVQTLLMQRVVGMALGYEDLNDHDELRHDPVLSVLAGKLEGRNRRCAALAGKSTLNRLERSAPSGPTRYQKISHDEAAIERLLVDLFLEAHAVAPESITLDLDATDDQLHGLQEGRFFHGYYGGYCYLPLYVFCGKHLLVAKLRKANIDASAGAQEELARVIGQIRSRWPQVQITLRADSGFARDALMAWCESNGIDYVFGLARNARLAVLIEEAAERVRVLCETSGKAAREFCELSYRTRDSWSSERRVVAKAEHLPGKANPRFVVTSLTSAQSEARALYEDVYCARGEMENRIKECQLDLFADRTSTATMRSNQLRLWLSSYRLRAAGRLAAHCPGGHRAGAGDLRQPATEAVEDRCASGAQRAPHQDRHGLQPSIPGPLAAGLGPAGQRRRLRSPRAIPNRPAPRFGAGRVGPSSQNPSSCRLNAAPEGPSNPQNPTSAIKSLTADPQPHLPLCRTDSSDVTRDVGEKCGLEPLSSSAPPGATPATANPLTPVTRLQNPGKACDQQWQNVRWQFDQLSCAYDCKPTNSTHPSRILR